MFIRAGGLCYGGEGYCRDGSGSTWGLGIDSFWTSDMYRVLPVVCPKQGWMEFIVEEGRSRQFKVGFSQ